MKKLLLLLFVLGLATFSYAQEDGFETISFGADFFRRETLPKPMVREVVGGTVIQVQYEGEEWEQNLERKSAFEYACRLLEEQMPTALPLKVNARFGRLRGNNVIANTALCFDSCNMAPGGYPYIERVVRPTTKYRFRDNGLTGMNVARSYFNNPDGVITFSDNDIFSYSLDSVVEDKYDFVTVVLRELCKTFGFCFTPRGDNINKVIQLEKGSFVRYDELVLSPDFDIFSQEYDLVGAYNRATSGNAIIEFSYGDSYGLYSPSMFENGRSLSFFKADEANTETRLMQPDLPRGTSIRNIGKWFRPFLRAMDWYTDIAVGGGGGGQGDATSTSTDKVKAYGKELSFDKSLKNRSVNSIVSYNYLNEMKRSSSDEVYDYVRQFMTYPELNMSSQHTLLGWSISILRKDGTWDIVKTANVMLPEIKFSTSEIDPVKALDYIRSSDGYLRCKLAHLDEDYYYDQSLPIPPGIYTFARYFLLDYLPQKPQLAFSKVMPQTRASDDEYYADVKIAFKNVEGTESILVEQLEEGSPVPFTFYVEDIRAGYFIASVDKEYSTTFRLRAMNKNGETISEQLLVSPLVPATYTLSSRVNKNVISLELRNSRKRNINKLITDYKVLDLKSSMIVQEGKVLDNNIDINSLGKGVYGLQVADEDDKSYNTKFIK